MSGQPNKEQIAQLKAAVIQRNEILRKLEIDVQERNKRTVLIEALRREADQRERLIMDLMVKMDVASDGNYGWPARALQFLTGLCVDDVAAEIPLVAID